MNFPHRAEFYARARFIRGVLRFQGVYEYAGKLRYTAQFPTEFEAIRAARAAKEALRA